MAVVESGPAMVTAQEDTRERSCERLVACARAMNAAWNAIRNPGQSFVVGVHNEDVGYVSLLLGRHGVTVTKSPHYLSPKQIAALGMCYGPSNEQNPVEM